MRWKAGVPTSWFNGIGVASAGLAFDERSGAGVGAGAGEGAAARVSAGVGGVTGVSGVGADDKTGAASIESLTLSPYHRDSSAPPLCWLVLLAFPPLNASSCNSGRC